MTKPSRSAALPLAAGLFSLLPLLPGCAAGDTEGDDPAAAPAGPHRSVGSFVMRVQPSAKRAEIRRLPAGQAARGLLSPQAFTSLPIVSDGVTGSGPANTVELATLSVEDTYGQAASATCPAGSFCGDVQFMHFFSGLNLSAVYVQITAITDANGNLETTHKAVNGVSSTPFGIDVSLGAWQHTALPGTLAASAGATKTWAFNNPDDADFYVYLDARAALYPTLWFGKTGITPTAPIVAGEPFTLHYEYARNTGCSGAQSYAWNGFLKAGNIDAHQVSFANQTGDTFFDVEMTAPFGGGMDMWFNKDTGSCQSWDSNGNSNYNVGITTPLPALHFGGPDTAYNPYWTTNWNVYADTGVTGGAAVTVDYELDRNTCTHAALDAYGRIPAGTSLQMFYSFDGGSFTGVSMLGTPYGVPTAGNGVTGQMLVPPTINIPSGSHSMTVYFYGAGPGCTNYDSSGGSNYTFYY